MGKRRKKKQAKFWLAGVAVAALGILTVWIVVGQAKQGTAVMEKAVEQMRQAAGIHANARLTINLPERMRSQKRPFTKVELAVEGDVARGEQALEMTGTVNTKAQGTGNIFFTEGEMRILTEEVAFKLNEFPVLLDRSGKLSGKWTYVPTQLLAIKPEGETLAVLSSLGDDLVYRGQEKIGQERTRYFTGAVADEKSRQWQEVWRARNSGNKGLDVVARLLAANKVKQIEVWVSKQDGQLRRIRANFVRPLKNGNEFDFATLDVTLTDYGRVVTVDRPDKELTVRPAVFAKLFGTGEIEEIRAER